MATFKVTMTEQGRDGILRTIQQIADCSTRQQVVDFYGLNQPDILDYQIELIKE